MIKAFLQKNGELTPLGRRWAKIMASAYALAIVCMCFLPQSWYPQYKDFETPGIVQIGRLYLLPYDVDTRTPARLKGSALSVEDLRGELHELAGDGEFVGWLDRHGLSKAPAAR